MSDMTNRERLEALAVAAYGTRWQTETANALAVSDRSVRGWVSGKTAVSDGVIRDLREIAKERVDLLRSALQTTETNAPETEWHPILTSTEDGSRTSWLISIGPVSMQPGEDGEAVCTVVEAQSGFDGRTVHLEFIEEIADGVFVSLNSRWWTWHRDAWVKALGSESAADVAFEATKGLLRLRHPELAVTVAGTAIREELSRHGFEIIGRDKDAHFHWLIRNQGMDYEGWHPSLQAAARELLLDAD